MQLLLRPVGLGAARTITVNLDPRSSEHTVGCVLRMAATQCRFNMRYLDHQLGLIFAGRQLQLSDLLTAHNITTGSTLHMVCSMKGGKPAKVQLLTHVEGCGPTVTIDVENDTPMFEVKLQLQEKTGIPVEHQKVMLQGIGNIVMGDKRSNIGYTHSGSTGSLYLGLLGTDK